MQKEMLRNQQQIDFEVYALQRISGACEYEKREVFSKSRELRRIKEKGGYRLGCNYCGSEPARSTLILNEQGRIEQRFRRCDPCSEQSYFGNSF